MVLVAVVLLSLGAAVPAGAAQSGGTVLAAKAESRSASAAGTAHSRADALAMMGLMGTLSGCEVYTFNFATGELQWGFTGSTGGGGGGIGAGVSGGGQVSNANQISDINGPFGMVGASVNIGEGASGDVFTGLGSCNQQIVGGDGQVGLGFGWNIRGIDTDYHGPKGIPFGGKAYAWSKTLASFNLYHVAHDAGISLYNFLSKFP